MRLDNLRPKGVVGTRSIDKEHWTHQVQPIRAKRGGFNVRSGAWDDRAMAQYRVNVTGASKRVARARSSRRG